MLYRRLVRPALFHLDPEKAHFLGLQALRAVGASRLVAAALRSTLIGSGREPVRVLGLAFEHGLGLAAGFDKNAHALWGLYALGFGFVEVGSVSARPWPGNPRPRVFRVPHERALINRMGLPSDGAEAVARRLRDRPPIPTFVNVTRTADPSLSGEAGVEDICRAIAVLAPVSDAFVLNLSCPNTPDGRTFQEPEALGALLRAVRARRGDESRPVLVKVSPDLARDSLDAVALAAMRAGARGFVACNTTLSREGLAPPPNGDWPAGGLSGPPMRERSLAVVRRLREVAGRDAVIVGCGGVESRQDVERFQEAGADLVEAYTGFIFGGPLFCKSLVK